MIILEKIEPILLLMEKIISYKQLIYRSRLYEREA